ncbi:MAG: hypothetical protein VX463_13665, partial [Pseudomonadota bacterium]|nr:hypothetical protein [Pseudomonadota bacterium]
MTAAKRLAGARHAILGGGRRRTPGDFPPHAAAAAGVTVGLRAKAAAGLSRRPYTEERAGVLAPLGPARAQAQA